MEACVGAGGGHVGSRGWWSGVDPGMHSTFELNMNIPVSRAVGIAPWWLHNSSSEVPTHSRNASLSPALGFSPSPTLFELG
jgi:hypothetical protein